MKTITKADWQRFLNDVFENTWYSREEIGELLEFWKTERNKMEAKK